MAATWPTSHDPYAAPMNAIPKVVFFSTLEAAHWLRSAIARGDLAHEIAALQDHPGGEIVAWGGARFAQSLSRAGLIDEYAIITRPVAYGSGEPLFRDLGETLELDVLATTAYAGGIMLHLYKPRR